MSSVHVQRSALLRRHIQWIDHPLVHSDHVGSIIIFTPELVEVLLAGVCSGYSSHLSARLTPCLPHVGFSPTLILFSFAVLMQSFADCCTCMPSLSYDCSGLGMPGLPAISGQHMHGLFSALLANALGLVSYTHP